MLIAHLKLQIEKLNRDRYGQRSERTARLLDQLELTLEQLETAATNGQASPGAVFYYSRDRAGEHPQAHLAGYSGIFQADAYGGYGKLYDPGRTGPILEAACWVHARRPFFVMADLAENARRTSQGKKPAVISPLTLEAVRRIDAMFEIERTANGQSAGGGRSGGLDAGATRSSRAATTSPRPRITCSSAGEHLPASSMTAASACQTMLPSVACAASLWAGNPGCSAVRIAAANALP